MFGNIMLTIIAILGTFVVILVGLSIRHYYVDPYDMEDDMKMLKQLCQKSSVDIDRLKEIKSKMEDCPTIGEKVCPIQVFNDNDKLYGLIVGDANGKPRFFAFRRGDYCISDYCRLRDTNERFKKQGLKHSICIDELNTFLIEAEKNIFKKDLEEKQIWDIKRHFK